MHATHCGNKSSPLKVLITLWPAVSWSQRTAQKTIDSAHLLTPEPSDNLALHYWGKREIEGEERRRSMWGLLKMEVNQEVKVRRKRRESECGRKKTTARQRENIEGTVQNWQAVYGKQNLRPFYYSVSFSLCRLLTATKPQPARQFTRPYSVFPRRRSSWRI